MYKKWQEHGAVSFCNDTLLVRYFDFTTARDLHTKGLIAGKIR